MIIMMISDNYQWKMKISAIDIRFLIARGLNHGVAGDSSGNIPQVNRSVYIYLWEERRSYPMQKGATGVRPKFT